MKPFRYNRMCTAAALAAALGACGQAVAPAPVTASPAVMTVPAVRTAPPVAAAPPVTPPAPVTPTVDSQWFAVSLAGAAVGRAHEVTEPATDGGATTRHSSELRIGRLGKTVEMTIEAATDEDALGHVRGVHTQTRLSRQVTTTDVSFQPGSATVRESAGGAAHDRTVPLTEPALGPAAVRRLLAAVLHAPGDIAEPMTWSAQLSAPSRVHYTVEARETVDIDGAARPVLRAKVVADGEGVPRTVWLDAAGRELRIEVQTPMGAMIVIATASEPSAVAEQVPEDVVARAVLRSNIRLPHPRSIDKLIVRLAFEGDAARLAALESPDERVTARDAGSAVIEIDRVRVPAVSTAGDAPGREALSASAIIDPGDPGVRAIAEQVLAGAPDDAWDRAQRLTRWVMEHMTPDAGIAFAPAAELARDRHGTCAGYAVLLASLLRAAGIPARLDIGVAYLNGMFGGHAWVEAHVRGRWIPLDAAIPGDGPADAARIAFARSALDQGPGPVFAAFGALMNHATVTVLGYAPAGRPLVRVDPAAKPYVIDGAHYTSTGLGLSLTAPAGYRFTDLDAVWPDHTLVALEGRGTRLAVVESAVRPGHDAVRAEAEALALSGTAGCQRAAIAGRRACATRGADAAGLAFTDGAALFVLQAKGPGARGLLDAVAASAKLTAAR